MGAGALRRIELGFASVGCEHARLEKTRQLHHVNPKAAGRTDDQDVFERSDARTAGHLVWRRDRIADDRYLFRMGVVRQLRWYLDQVARGERDILCIAAVALPSDVAACVFA